MGSDVAESFARVREAIAQAGAELPAGPQALRELEEAESRHRRTGSHTVVALVGGTGSGKSTLFNALTRSRFADPGPARPSTRRASACAWGVRADELLDFLGVERRMFLDTLLEREGQRPLDGLVLLDLPDHDSVEEHHSEQVDRLLPVVDVLIWVVDPQKYADHILHELYLADLRTRADAMVMVLNQVDTLDPDGRAAIVADIRRLLAEEGLGDVPVLETCGLSGAGVPALRDVLADAVAAESTADRTAASAIDRVARGLLRQVGPPAEPPSDADLGRTVDDLLRATGVGAVAASIGTTVSRRRGGALAEPQRPSRAAVAAIGSQWAGRAKGELPASWAHAVDDALPGVEELRERTAAAVGSVPVPPASATRAAALDWAAAGAGVLALGIAVLGIALDWPAGWIVGGGLALIALAATLAATARASRAHTAQERAEGYENEVRAALTETARAVLAEPTRRVLERHRSVGTALAGVLRASTGGRSGPPSPG